MGRLWLCVNLPMWPINRVQRKRRRDRAALERSASGGRRREPVILLYVQRHGKQLVQRCCAVAAGRGVRPGMTVAQATALLDRPAVLLAWEPEQDVLALQALARWCVRLTPRVMPILGRGSSHGLMLDMTGCDRLYGGPHRMVELCVGTMRRLRLDASAALAPTRVGAQCLARGDRSPMCVAEHLAEMRLRLESLGIETLDLEPAEREGLAEVGIDRVDQVRRLPRDEVVQRFGPGVLRQLNLAFGEVACEDIEPIRPWLPPTVELRFQGPTTQFEAVQQAVEHLTQRLADRLHQRLRSASSLTLEVERMDRDLRPEFVEQVVTLSRPSRDGRHLWALLRPHIERLHLGHGVEAFKLSATRAPRVGLTQLGPGDSRVEDDELEAADARLVDLLSARLGPERVCRPVPVPTHIPEADVVWRPAGELGPGDLAHDPQDPAWADAQDAMRPTWLLDPAESARVTLLNPEGPVLSLGWRGQTRQLRDCIGPKRIGPRWWKSPATRVRIADGPDRSPGTASIEPARAADDPPTLWGSSPPDRPARPGLRPKPHETAGIPGDGPPLPPAPSDRSAPPVGPSQPPAPASLPLWSDLAARDYYRVQDEAGLWLWVFRRLDTGRWFVHGLWV
jgi:protein ImuB